MERLQHLSSQLQPNSTSARTNVTEKRPDDVVITTAFRTPLGKAGKGGFKDMSVSELVTELLKESLAKTSLDPKVIEDSSIGNVGGINAMQLRAATMAAGIPYTAGTEVVNRQCASGLQAIANIANRITTGEISAGLAVGSESMSSDYGPGMVKEYPQALKNQKDSNDTQLPMGITNENIFDKYNISREDSDKFAASSHNKAAAAQEKGLFDSEIVPINARQVDDDDKETFKVISKDEGIRPGTTAEKLGKLKPAFRKDGKTTAGSSSQLTDGAAMVILMRRSVAEKLNQPILGKFVDARVAGVPPEIMGIGPGVAIPKLLEATGLTNADVDLFEINEAFAAQTLSCVKMANLDLNKLNVRGGAIALGHPLGCSGCRLVVTLLNALKHENKQVGVASLCIGGGQGLAALIVRE